MLLSADTITDIDDIALLNACEALAKVLLHLMDTNGIEGYDIEEAEMLARRGLSIQEKHHGKNNRFINGSLFTLVEILQQIGGEDYDEVKDLLERCLAIHMKYDGIESDFVMTESFGLAQFHYEMGEILSIDNTKIIEQLCWAESYCKESLRIVTKWHGVADIETVKYESFLAKVIVSLNLE